MPGAKSKAAKKAAKKRGKDKKKNETLVRELREFNEEEVFRLKELLSKGWKEFIKSSDEDELEDNILLVRSELSDMYYETALDLLLELMAIRKLKYHPDLSTYCSSIITDSSGEKLLPLHYAIRMGSSSSVKCLLSVGATAPPNGGIIPPLSREICKLMSHDSNVDEDEIASIVEVLSSTSAPGSQKSILNISPSPLPLAIMQERMDLVSSWMATWADLEMRVTPNIYGEWLADGGKKIRELFPEPPVDVNGSKKKLRRTTLNMLMKQLNLISYNIHIPSNV